MNSILVLSTGLNKQELLAFLNKKGDFCAAMIDPALGKNFQMAKIYIERHKNNIFLIVNKGGFGLADAQYITWKGDYTKMLHLFESQPFHVAYMALSRFVSKMPDSKTHMLLNEALDEVHYGASHLVRGEPEYMVEEVPHPRVDNKRKARAKRLYGRDDGQEKQLTMF